VYWELSFGMLVLCMWERKKSQFFVHIVLFWCVFSQLFFSTCFFFDHFPLSQVSWWIGWIDRGPR
jgi:hypothetical protein